MLCNQIRTLARFGDLNFLVVFRSTAVFETDAVILIQHWRNLISYNCMVSSLPYCYRVLLGDCAIFAGHALLNFQPNPNPELEKEGFELALTLVCTLKLELKV